MHCRNHCYCGGMEIQSAAKAVSTALVFALIAPYFIDRIPAGFMPLLPVAAFAPGVALSLYRETRLRREIRREMNAVVKAVENA